LFNIDEIIYGNKFCNEFFDNDKVVFFHTSKINFNEIWDREDDSLILITHNSDECITDHHVNLMPKSVKKWFCQNKISNHPKLQIIPSGIECPYEALKKGHGVGYERSIKSLNVLSSDKYDYIEPQSLVYANFRVHTNPRHRSLVRDICAESNHILLEESNLDYDDFIMRIKSHECVVCPDGNGPDNHRFWETIYCGRIPITFNTTLYESMYKNLPVILCTKKEELYSESWIKSQIEAVNNEDRGLDIAKFSYWKNLILKELE
jgi:hypothetical protein